MMKIKQLIIGCKLVLFIAFAFPAYAETVDENEEAGWYFNVIVGAMREPTYLGSDKYITEAGGDFQATYNTGRGIEYFLSLGEFGASVELGNDWELTTFLEYEEGRDNSEDPILAHFPKVRDTLEGQVILAKHIKNWTIAGILQPDILDRGKGFVYFLALEHDYKVNQRLSLSTSLDISFGNAEHMNTEVGVSSSVAALSGLNAYRPGSGYKSTTLDVELDYAINKNWSIVSGVEVEFYGSNIADSPLVKDEGSDTNYTYGLGISYRF